MAISTIHTYLMVFDAATDTPTKADISKAKKVADIKTFPDLGGKPNQLDATTLSDETEVKINGLEKTDTMDFEINYTLADHKSLVALKDKEQWYGVFFGASNSGAPDGHNGVFVFKGSASNYVKSGKADEVLTDDLTIARSTKVSFIDPTDAA